MIILQGITVEDLLQRIEAIVERKIEEKVKIEKKQLVNYLTRKEAAALLKITLPTLHEWTKLGWLTGYRIGTRVLYKLNEIEAAMTGTTSRIRRF